MILELRKSNSESLLYGFLKVSDSVRLTTAAILIKKLPLYLGAGKVIDAQPALKIMKFQMTNGH